jgi:hypothetical protein
VGSSWRVIAVKHNGHTVVVPKDVRNWLSFYRGGAFSAYDSVNWTASGRYRIAVGRPSFSISGGETTLAFYVGDDSAKLMVIGVVGSIETPGVKTVADVHGAEMLLHVRGYRVLCARVATLPDKPGSH